jgi:hypothetical protein
MTKYTIILLSVLFLVSGCGKHSISQERAYNPQPAQESLDKFRQTFAQLDARVQTGISYSNACAMIQIQPVVRKRDNGTFDAYFIFATPPLAYTTYSWLTNGFYLRVSNDIVFYKGYSYSSKY